MIKEPEAMKLLGISSRMTIAKYIREYNFPKPVTTYPKQFLLAEVEAWILSGGVNQKAS